MIKPIVAILGAEGDGMFPPYSMLVQEYNNSTKSPFDLVVCSTAVDLIKKLQDAFAVVLLFNINDKHDVSELVKVLQSFRPAIKNNLFRFIGIESLHNDQVTKFLNKSGCKEFIVDTINIKSLKFKIDLHIKPVIQAAKKLVDHNENLSNYMVSLPKEEPKADLSPGMALSLKSDCWLLEPDEISYDEKKWEIKVSGPGPNAGSWKSEPRRENEWIWLQKNDSVFPFVKDSGAWKFRGEKPVYNMKAKMWIFSGGNISLHFEMESGAISYRFRTSKNLCSFARNSNQAIDAMELIHQSWDPKFVETDNVPAKNISLKSFEGRVETFGDISINFSSVNLNLEMQQNASDSYPVTISDLVDNYIVVKASPGNFNLNDDVFLRAHCNYIGTKMSFEMNGLIKEQLNREDGSVITTVELYQFKQEELDQLIDLYQQRQENADKFFKISKAM